MLMRARRCPSGPEPPRPCCAGSRSAVPRPLPLLSSPAPTRHQAGPPALFLPVAPLNRHKKASLNAVPRFAVFPSQAPVHRASSPTSFPSTPYPPTTTERHRTALVSARTAPPPAFIGERRPELRSVTTNCTPTHCPPPPSCRSTPRPSATTVPAPSPSTELDSTTPPSCHPLGEPHLRFSCPTHPPWAEGALIEDLATGERATAPSRAWAASAAGPGRQAVAQPAAHGRPPRRSL
jgi:hypothetical protein